MLDINLLREKPKLVKDSEKKRGKSPKLVDEVLLLDDKWKKKLKKVEQLKHERNVVSLEINEIKKRGESGANKIKEMKEVVGEIRKQEEKADKLLEKRNLALGKVSNIMHEKVPKGKDEKNNKVVKKWGKIPKFKFKIKNHVEIIEGLGIGDFDAPAKTSGKGFYYLKGDLALLNQALIRFTIDFMLSKSYVYIETPLMIRKDICEAAEDFEAFETKLYKVEGEDLYLIPSAEHSILGFLKEQAIFEDKLPVKVFSYSMCFRKEIGSHGINEKGLWRTHQFNKVEQFIFCKPEDSWKYYKELRKNTEEIMKALGLPYRIFESCSGDLGDWKARGEDVEVYRPTTKEYGEAMSLSNCTDFQARDLNIKGISKKGERYVLHTLNNTAIATSRIMVAILENFQTKEGNVRIPKVLWLYMGGVKVLRGKASGTHQKQSF